MNPNQYLHDAWLNFIPARSFAEVPEFFEWSELDKVKLYDQIIIVKVNTGFMAKVLDNLYFKLSNELHTIVRDASYVRTQSKLRKPFDGFIITDGEYTLALDVDEEGNVVYASKLTPPQENAISIKTANTMAREFTYTPQKDYNEAIPKEAFVGLSRTERESKRLIYVALQMIKDDDSTASLNKARYLYSEFFDTKYGENNDKTAKEIVEWLLHSILHGYTEKHEQLLETITKLDKHFGTARKKIVDRSKKYGVRQ